MATGMVLVIVMRHIDLSVGSIIGFVSTIIGVAQVRILPIYLGLDNPAIWIIGGRHRARARRRDRRPSRIARRLYRDTRLHRHPRRPVVLARRGLVGDDGADDRAARRALRLDGRRTAWFDRRAGKLGACLVACAVIVFSLYAQRQRRARFRFPQRPMWAEYLIAVVGCLFVIGATAIMNAYPWPERVAAAYAEANHIPVPEGGLFISTGYAIPVLIALVIGVAMTFLARRTRFGRYVYAIGGNPEAAELAGINTKRITILVFALMGMLAAVAACIDSARLDSATNVLGQLDELYTIAAAVIGGTSLAGGVGTIYGAIIGALVIQSLQSGMVLLGFDSAFQQMVVGVVLVGAVGIDTFYRRRTAKG